MVLIVIMLDNTVVIDFIVLYYLKQLIGKESYVG